MHGLVVGAGSIGQRHIRNLVSTCHNVSIVETDVNKREQLSLDYNVYNSIEEAFSKDKFDIALICTPTKNHIPQAQELALRPINGLMVEKPLSYNLDGTSTLVNICKEKNIKLMTGCNLLFSSGIQLVKTLLNNNTIGKILYADYFFGHYLPYWHPGTDYRKSYSASETGGIILDDIHAINLFIFLFGKPSAAYGHLYKTGALDIKKEDIADYNIEFEKSIITHLHSDYLSKEYTRNMQIFGDKGTVQWDFYNNVVNLLTESIPEWRTFDVKEDTNEMYLKEMKYFIDCVEKGIEIPFNGISELEIVVKIKKQNESI